jgi:hypothetical protein
VEQSEEKFYTVQEVAARLRFSERKIIRILDRMNDPTVLRDCAPGTTRVYRRIPQSALDRMIKDMQSTPVPIKKAASQEKKKLPPIRLNLGRKTAA